MSLLAARRRLLRGSIHSSVPQRFAATFLRRDAAKRWSMMTVVGTGFGDRFKVFRGGSGPFGEGVRRAEELAVLQGKRASKRCSLAV
jgi:hypothetical protein